MAEKEYESFFNDYINDFNRNIKTFYENAKTYYIASRLGEEIDPEKYQIIQDTPTSFEVKDSPGFERYSKAGTGVIDLKEGMKRSSSAKRKKNGGWYIIIPMERYSPSSKKATDSNKMTRKEYDFLRTNADMGQTVVDDYLYSKRDWSSPVPELQYKPKSRNVTRVQRKSKKGKPLKMSNYIVFRTVSDKSPANSWLLNRQTVDPDNVNDDTQRIIDKVRRLNNGS